MFFAFLAFLAFLACALRSLRPLRLKSFFPCEHKINRKDRPRKTARAQSEVIKQVRVAVRPQVNRESVAPPCAVCNTLICFSLTFFLEVLRVLCVLCG